jgi:hypothetical protein
MGMNTSARRGAQMDRQPWPTFFRFPRIAWENFRSLIWWRVIELSWGDEVRPKFVEPQAIKARAALQSRGLLGYHEIGWNVKYIWWVGALGILVTFTLIMMFLSYQLSR